jgi:membrane protein implicated in regulation of membrane protease activity
MRGPMGDFVRRALSWGIVSSLLLPILTLVVIGLGALLSALGDALGARFCGRVALLVAVIWLLAVVATAVLAGIATLAAEEGRRGGGPRRHRHRMGPRRRRRRLREPMEGEPRQESWGDRPGKSGRPARRDPGAE